MAMLISPQTSERRYLVTFLLNHRESILQKLEALALKRGVGLNLHFNLLIAPFLPRILEDFTLLLLSTQLKVGSLPLTAHGIRSADEVAAGSARSDLPQMIREYHLLKSVLTDLMKSEKQSDVGSYQLLQQFFDDCVERIASQLSTPVLNRETTDQFNYRESLKASEERFHQLSESLTHQVVHVMELNPQRLSYVSPSFESIWRLPLSEVYQNPNSFMSRVHPEDQAKLWAALRCLSEGNESDVEFRLLFEDGSIRWIKDHSSPLKNKEGKIYRATGIAEDITERKMFEHRLKESEAKFRTIADAMPQMVWSTLPNGFHDYYNQRWYEFTGMMPGTTDGEAWNGMFHPDDQDKAWSAWNHSLQTGEPYQIEYRLRHRSGQYRWTLGRALPVRDEQGDIIRWMGTCTDIQGMRETAEALTRAVEARDEFLSIASHELKTPLTSLKLQTQLMKRDREKGDPSVYSVRRVDKMLSQTDEQVLRLTRLIDDMLDISRIRSGNLAIQKECFDLGQLVLETTERLQPHFLATGYQAPKIQVDPDCSGEWDRLRIEQVLINLLTNSIRYGNHKPIFIRVEDLERKVRLSVCDQGIGIAVESQAKIFDRFERAITANEVSGLGLGLYITRKIVEAHHGRIWVESKLGQGSTFSVELPAQHCTHL